LLRVDVVEMRSAFSKEYWSRIYRKQIPKLLRQIIKAIIFVVLAVIADFLLLYILTVLTAANLIDWKVVVSFLVVEVLAALFAKIFRIGGPSETEEKNQKIALSISLAKFSHLVILSIEDEGHSYNYPNSHFRIVNTKAKTCYWIPSFLKSLVEEEDILSELILEDETKWQNYISENGIEDKHEFPTLQNLMQRRGKRKA